MSLSAGITRNSTYYNQQHYIKVQRFLLRIFTQLFI
jgi:hypothetical protein